MKERTVKKRFSKKTLLVRDWGKRNQATFRGAQLAFDAGQGEGLDEDDGACKKRRIDAELRGKISARGSELDQTEDDLLGDGTNRGKKRGLSRREGL